MTMVQLKVTRYGPLWLRLRIARDRDLQIDGLPHTTRLQRSHAWRANRFALLRLVMPAGVCPLCVTHLH